MFIINSVQRGSTVSSQQPILVVSKYDIMLITALFCNRFVTTFVSSIFFSFDDGDFDDAEEDEGLDDLENVEDVR